MSQNFQTTYQPLAGANDHVGLTLDEGDRDDDLSPDTHSSMVFHTVPKSSKSRWNHMENLDWFFIQLYRYHQNHGMLCMALQQMFELAQFAFMMFFTVFLFTCVDYDVLFRNKLPSHPHLNPNITDKITLYDVIRTHDQCMAHYSWKLVLFTLMASLFWLARLFHSIYMLFRFWEIKLFFNNALGIIDKDLNNITWEEVEQRVMEVQIEQRMCIHKESLSELDIYHRILRSENYFIAMVNKDIIPLKMDVPFMGEMVFFTKGLRFNIEFMLFWGPWAPFRKCYQLKEEFKRLENRHHLAEELQKQFLYVGVVNLALFPFVLMFQILYSFFHYAEVIKREPGSLGSRRWSHYGEVYLRHFNELDHEMMARLNRGYKAASQYMNIFSSPIMAIVSKHIALVSGAVLMVLAGLSVYDEDVLQVEHILTIMTCLGAVIAACRVFIPDENLVFCPEILMRRVLAEVHYLPDHWREKAHCSTVRKEFSQLFQYRAIHILEELVSPIITPLILIFKLRFKALDVVDFFRNFTVEVVGVGDVCSFAQMDIRKHGSPTWQPDTMAPDHNEPSCSHKQGMTADGGKTELSLLHFTMTNPRWKPPQESSAFITALKTQAQRDMNNLTILEEENALYSSLNSLSYGGGLGLGTTSLLQPWMIGAPGGGQLQQSLWSGKGVRGRMSRVEGSRHGPTDGIFSMIKQSNIDETIGGSSVNTSGPLVDPVMAPSTLSPTSMMGNSVMGMLPQDLTAVDMSLSTLFLHELHQRRRARSAYTDHPHPPPSGPQGPPGGTFQSVVLHEQQQPQPSTLSDTPSVSFQRTQEKRPLLREQ